jgi:hypothetical protein
MQRFPNQFSSEAGPLAYITVVIMVLIIAHWFWTSSKR